MNESFEESVETLCLKDPRYDADAYYFLREALDAIMRSIQENESRPRHISADELLEGFREYALDEFGPLTLLVLNAWGLRGPADIGELVFNLVEAGKLGKEDKDRKADFAEGYDFFEAFARPFEPKNPPPTLPPANDGESV